MSIETEIKRIKYAKNNIKQALRHKGVKVDDEETLDTYHNKISSIKTLIIDDFSYFCYKGLRLDLLNNPNFDASNGKFFSFMFADGSNLTTIPELNTSNGIVFSNMFKNCNNLTTIPELNTSNGTYFVQMFNNCSSLTEIPKLDVSNGIGFYGMFSDCSNLTTIPELNTSKGTEFVFMFQNCSNLTEILKLDVSNGANLGGMFENCVELTNLTLLNVKSNLSVFHSSKLTTDSLINLCYELRNTDSIKTLTLGSTNKAKLENVYIKLVDITDEMRAEDQYIDEKLPFIICENIDEGAILITDYVTIKNWTIV